MQYWACNCLLLQKHSKICTVKHDELKNISVCGRLSYTHIHPVIYFSLTDLLALCIGQRNIERATDCCCKITAYFAQWNLINEIIFHFTHAVLIQSFIPSFSRHQNSSPRYVLDNAIWRTRLIVLVTSRHTLHGETWWMNEHFG